MEESKRNTIITVVLSSIILIVYFVIAMFVIKPKNQAAQQNIQSAESTVEASQNEEKTPVQINSVTVANSTSNEVEKNYTVTTDKAIVTFTNRGGDIVSYKFIDEKGKQVEMADKVTEINRAFALNFGDSTGSLVNEIFNVNQNDKSITFVRDYIVKDAEGKSHSFKLGKKYTFKDGDEVFKLEIAINSNSEDDVLNFNGAAYTLRTSPQIGPEFNPKDRYDVRDFVSYTGSKKNSRTFDTRTYTNDWTWACVASKYFCMIVSPENPSLMSNNIKCQKYGKDLNITDQIFMTRNASNETKINDVYYVYVGPRNEGSLIKYNSKDKNAWNLFNKKFNESLKSSTILRPIEIALKWCLEMIYKLVKNWGVAIIILTIILKIVLFPLNLKSSLGTVKMQELQPKMQELQERYKNDQQKLSEETTKLYKQSGYNPMSGCLPMIIQMIILITLYQVLNNYYEFRGASFIPGWIDDLSVGDSVFSWKKNIWLISALSQNNLRLLPIIYTISQLISSWITQMGSTAGAGQNQTSMKMMMYVMPIMFFFLFYNVASGLLLYWAVSNILQIFQQIVINIVMKKKKAEAASKIPAVNKNVLKFKGGKKKTR